MRRLTIATQYYRNPKMLAHQVGVWLSYPPEARKRLTIVIADDCSPEADAAWSVVRYAGLDIRVYRLTEPMVWGHQRARNVALHEAPDGWCCVTDIDHVLPAESAIRLMTEPLDPACYYVPARRTPSGHEAKRHPNSYIMRRSLFWATGGCDETLCGYYGSDSILRNRLPMFGRREEHDAHLVVYNLGGQNLVPEIDDAGTRDWPRKHSEYHARHDPAMRAYMKDAYKRPAAKVLAHAYERVL